MEPTWWQADSFELFEKPISKGFLLHAVAFWPSSVLICKRASSLLMRSVALDLAPKERIFDNISNWNWISSVQCLILHNILKSCQPVLSISRNCPETWRSLMLWFCCVFHLLITRLCQSRTFQSIGDASGGSPISYYFDFSWWLLSVLAYTRRVAWGLSWWSFPKLGFAVTGRCLMRTLRHNLIVCNEFV